MTLDEVLNQTSQEDARQIIRIVDRAVLECDLTGFSGGRMGLEMDITACHAIIPLDLRQLHDFPPADFGHDIVGIYCNLNRTTLEMENCFVPRCALPESFTCEGCLKRSPYAESQVFRQQRLCGDCYERAIPSCYEIAKAERNFGA